jgi:hypothetical protein
MRPVRDLTSEFPSAESRVERPSRWRRAMRSRRRLLACLAATILAACDHSTPSRSEALDALRSAAPTLDGAPVSIRVWQDGPPWFSCAEVLAKLGSPTDADAVHDEVGNWRPLIASGWLVVRDSSYGAVVDPGWCVAQIANDSAKRVQGWIPFVGDSFPTGRARRGWTVPVGRRRLVLTASPKRTGSDSVMVSYAGLVQPNANGAAMRIDRDTARATALLRRVDGKWQVVELARPK